jgi:glutamyl-tRNA synthetase
MTNQELAELIFPDIKLNKDDYEKKYPRRNLPKGTRVTRFAPSPTGFVHIGNFFQALISYVNAKNTNGVFYLRNEDTDKRREKAGAVELVLETLNHYGTFPDEYELNKKIYGNYGPYVQSKRKDIYHTFAKYLVEIGRAYPCFCTQEELSNQRELQSKENTRTGYYGKYAKCRNLNNEEIAEKILLGTSYVIRFRSKGSFSNKFIFKDLVRGRIEFPENDFDIVILKSGEQLPTYHFAHIIDDHFMRTTHVVRGEEWLSSVPVHIEMFETMGWVPPKYIHNPLILKKDGESLRKISKRKDPEASMKYFEEKGYPSETIIDSLMTIINSNFEDWRRANPLEDFRDFKFNPQKMNSSGALYSLDKLDNISKNYISKMTAIDLYTELCKWTKKYDPEFYKLIRKNKAYTVNILNIERGNKNPRKDFTCYSEIKKNIWYLYDELFDIYKGTYEWQKIRDIEEIREILELYLGQYYDINDDKDTWWEKVKSLCNNLGYASSMKEYNTNPQEYRGNIADISNIIRVAVTSQSRTPDLYEILQVMGIDRINRRIKKLFQ